MKKLMSIQSIAIVAIAVTMVIFSSCKKDDDPDASSTDSNKPKAAFVASTSNIEEGEIVDFTCKSTNSPTSWLWDFGNGNTSTLQNPSNKFETEGAFTVSLTATNADGSDTEAKANFITVLAPTGELLTDYDGNSYHTIEIGMQTWMKENIKVTHYPDGTAIPYVTDNVAWADLGDNNDDDAYCFYNNNLNNEKDTYGALYTWAAAMGGTGYGSNGNPSGVQGVCPDGWHLPSDNEWSQLMYFLGGRMVSGGKMKEAGTSHWLSPNTDATNVSGFTGLPSGYRKYNQDAKFINLTETGYYWSATEYDGSRSYLHYLRYNYVQGARNSNKNSMGYSVRCVKN